MENVVTKDDLRQFGLVLMNDIREMIGSAAAERGGDNDTIHPDWLKSRVVRKLMDMSPNTLQNLRLSGKVRFRKIMGSYYYNKPDLLNLFNER